MNEELLPAKPATPAKEQYRLWDTITAGYFLCFQAFVLVASFFALVLLCDSYREIHPHGGFIAYFLREKGLITLFGASSFIFSMAFKRIAGWVLAAIVCYTLFFSGLWGISTYAGHELIISPAPLLCIFAIVLLALFALYGRGIKIFYKLHYPAMTMLIAHVIILAVSTAWAFYLLYKG